jgi:hypothetical protein
MTRTLTELLRALEERSRQCPNRVVRLTGTVDAEPCELLIFRGFSSSTTHPTSFDPDAPVLLMPVVLENAELLEGPLQLEQVKVLMGPMTPEQLLDQAIW